MPGPGRMETTLSGVRTAARRLTARPSDIAAILVVIGVLERFYRFGAILGDQHAFRQTQTASQVWLFDRFGFDLFEYHVPMFGGGVWLLEFPFYQWIVYGLTLVAGFHEELGRLVSITSYVVSAAALYGITARLTGRRAAAVGAVFFLSFLPASVFYTRAFMIDPFLIMTALVMLYAGLRLADGFSWRWSSVCGAALLVTALGKANLVVIFGLPVLIVGVRLLLNRSTPAAGRAALLAWPLATGGLFLAWLRHADALNEASNGMTFAALRHWYLGTTFTDTELWRTVLQRMLEQLTPVGLVVVVLGALAIPHLRTPYRLETGALVVGAAVSIGIFANLNRVHDYYQLPYYTTLSLLGGIGLCAILDGVGRVSPAGALRLAAAIGVCLGLLWWVGLMGTYFAKDAVNTGWRAQGRELAANTPDRRLLLIQENADPNEPNIWYEARRIGWRVRNDDERTAARIVRGTPDLGAIVVILGAGGVPLWARELAAERGFRNTHTSTFMVVFRAPA